MRLEFLWIVLQKLNSRLNFKAGRGCYQDMHFANIAIICIMAYILPLQKFFSEWFI